jgi:hypothetical protein
LVERIFINLIEKIIQVQNSHIESPGEDSLLSRNWEFIFSDFDGWLILYCSTLKQPGGYWLYPMLLPNNKVEDLKKQLPSFSLKFLRYFSPKTQKYDFITIGYVA